MIKYCSENKNCLTPSFISSALSGITHRFVLVLECEVRAEPGTAANPTENDGKTPPRFAIGGPRATIDPRSAKIEELLPLVKHKLELPNGWEKVHNYIYVLQPSTDEHGWQYRSVWSNGPIGENQEAWVKSNSHGLDARRRLWITTVVKEVDVKTAKTKLSEAVRAKARGVIILGDLYRQEQKTLRKVWQKRFVVLTDNRIEIFINSGGKKIAELSLAECDIKMLFGVQCPGRDFAFSIRDSRGGLVGLFDADNREIRRRWVVAIRYQLALHCQGINFPQFDYGPPTGDEPITRVLMCGELQKQGHSVKTWKNRFFQLTPVELQYYEKEEMRGSYLLVGSTVNENEKTGALDFSLLTESGLYLLMRADTLSHKTTWVKAINRQIGVCNDKKNGIKRQSVRTSIIKNPNLAAAAVAAAKATQQQEAAAPAPAPAPVPVPEIKPAAVAALEEPTTTTTSVEEVVPEVVLENVLDAPLSTENIKEVEPDTGEMETSDEMVEIIRRYTIGGGNNMMDDRPDPSKGWEDPTEEENPANAEGRSSISIRNNNNNPTGRSNSLFARPQSTLYLSPIVEETTSNNNNSSATEDDGFGGNNNNHNNSNGEELIVEEEELPDDDEEDVDINMFQGLEISANAKIDMDTGEFVLSAGNELVAEPEEYTELESRSVSTASDYNNSSSRSTSTASTSGVSKLANLGRTLAKRVVELRPDTVVGGAVHRIEKRQPRYI